MRKILSVLFLMSLMPFGFSNDVQAAAGESDVCWKASYGRGVGTIPGACGYLDKSGLLCYPKCKKGYKGVSFVCWQSCPRGYRDDGAFCAKPKSYGRGAGYPWKFGDKAFSLASAKKRCEKKHGNNRCEKTGQIYYPKCKKGFHKVGCCVCSPNCRLGQKDIGVSCAKKSYTRKTILPKCGSGKEYDAGLCYKNCKKGYDGVGPVCWGYCPKSHPVNCGASCAKTKKACTSSVTDQVLSVVQVVADVGLTVVTAGSGTAAKAAAKTSAKLAAKTIAKQSAKKLGKKYTKRTIKAAFKELERQTGKKIDDKTQELWGQRLSSSDPNQQFDYADLDPTGIADVVKAYNKPICKVDGYKTASAKPSKPSRLPSSSKVSWKRLAGAANDIGVGAKGHAWIIGTNKVSGGYSIYRMVRGKWKGVPGGGVRITVGPRANAFIVNNKKHIYRYDGDKWIRMPGTATDIAAGAKGHVWIIGTNKEAGGYGIYRWNWNSKKWTKINGSAMRIAVGPRGHAWVVNSKGGIFRFDGRKWVRMPGAARDIGIGSRGHVWIVGTNKVSGGYGVWRWTGKTWSAVPGGLTNIAVGPVGKVWGVNSSKKIYWMK